MVTEPTESGASKPSLRSLAPATLLPTMVFEISNGAILPVIVLTATDLDATPATAAVMLGLLGVGKLIGDVPSGALSERLGDRRSMLAAATLALLAFIGCIVAKSPLQLGAALILIGVSSAMFNLARHSYMIDAASVDMRARAMSSLAGSHRIGLFIGPFLGAAAISAGGLRAAYFVAIAAAVLTFVILLVVPEPTGVPARSAAPRVAGGSFRALVVHRRLFATLGLGIFAVGAVRAVRQAVIPLWGEHLGIGPEVISVIFGVAAAVDMTLFYPAGKMMDRYGRLAVAVPSMVILGASIMALPLSGDARQLTVVAVVMSIGNGIGTGIMMTLGADAAPVEGRGRFLGVWRLFADTGHAAGPVLISVMAGVWSLATGIAVVGSVGFLAAAALSVWAPHYSPYATRGAARR